MYEQERWVRWMRSPCTSALPRTTVHRRIESKSLPAHRVGRLWKVQRSQVDAWIVEGRAAQPRGNEESA